MNPQFIANLFYRYTRGELTASQKAALDNWRKDFPRNEELFQELTDPELMRLTSIDIEKSRERVYQLIQEKIPGLWEKPKLISFRLGRIAAVLLILLIGARTYMYFNDRVAGVHPGSYEANLISPDGVGHALDDFHRGLMDGLSGVKIRKDENGNRIYIPVNDSNAQKDKYFTLSTTRGSYYSVLLPDSTTVYLNAESSLRYPANFHQDTIRLFVEGEAYFEVNRESLHPLIVNFKPNALQLSMYTGRFNVMSYTNEPFKVSMVDGSSQIGSASGKGSPVLNLNPNENALMNNGNLTVKPSTVTNEIIAWKKGRFLYKDRSLQDMLPAIGRWYDVDIVYLGKIPERRFNLDLSRDAELSEVIKALQQQRLFISQTKRTIYIGS